QPLALAGGQNRVSLGERLRRRLGKRFALWLLGRGQRLVGLLDLTDVELLEHAFLIRHQPDLDVHRARARSSPAAWPALVGVGLHIRFIGCWGARAIPQSGEAGS